MPKPKLKPIPSFASEAEEHAFWETADTTEYFDWSQARRVVFPISSQPYQSLMKVYLAERVATERLQRRGEDRPRVRPKGRARSRAK